MPDHVIPPFFGNFLICLLLALNRIWYVRVQSSMVLLLITKTKHIDKASTVFRRLELYYIAPLFDKSTLRFVDLRHLFTKNSGKNALKSPV